MSARDPDAAASPRPTRKQGQSGRTVSIGSSAARIGSGNHWGVFPTGHRTRKRPRLSGPGPRRCRQVLEIACPLDARERFSTWTLRIVLFEPKVGPTKPEAILLRRRSDRGPMRGPCYVSLHWPPFGKPKDSALAGPLAPRRSGPFILPRRCAFSVGPLSTAWLEPPREQSGPPSWASGPAPWSWLAENDRPRN